MTFISRPRGRLFYLGTARGRKRWPQLKQVPGRHVAGKDAVAEAKYQGSTWPKKMAAAEASTRAARGRKRWPQLKQVPGQHVAGKDGRS
ncbi:hypothetical protein [Bacillus safensis]|uniref:hypothetical protein n=1 Tax=Bacillus safensis TaxID=561879 RepID=UPI000F05E621|nr:hypothetical protein [Bacillus safensis]MED4639445.1 hypothetical protein [Bacillus safensis]